jgi:hypothetical protein
MLIDFPYLGKDPYRAAGERCSDNVVMRLLEPYIGKERNVAVLHQWGHNKERTGDYYALQPDKGLSTYYASL